MGTRTHRPSGARQLILLLSLVSMVLVAATPALAHGTKGRRGIVMFDIIPRLDPPTVDWHDLTDAYWRQVLNTASANECITPMPVLGSYAFGAREQVDIGPPENTSNGDYCIWGELGRDGQGYRITLNLVTAGPRELVARGSCSFEKPEDGRAAAQVAALNIGSSDKGSKPLADVILDFEKRKREEFSHKVALGAEVSFDLPDSEKWNLRLVTGEDRTLTIRYVDCDSYKLKGPRKVHVWANKGTIDQEWVTLDENGEGKVTYTAPDKPGEDTVRVLGEYCHGSERWAMPTADEVTVKVVRRITKFAGHIDVALSTSSRVISQGKVIEQSQSEETIGADLVGALHAPNPISSDDPCWISGLSAVEWPNPKELFPSHQRRPISVNYSGKSYSWDEGEKKLIPVANVTGSGSVENFLLNMDIEEYQPMPTTGQPVVPLTRCYQMSLFIGGLRGGALGPQLQEQLYDRPLKKWRSREDPSSLEPSALQWFAASGRKDPGLSPLLITEAGALEAWVKHPRGTLVLSAQGGYSSDEAGRQFQVSAKVVVTLTPQAK